MKRSLFFIALWSFGCIRELPAQVTLTAEEVVQRSIAFHDPEGQWARYQATLFLREKRPGRMDRHKVLLFDLPNGTMEVLEERDSVTLRQGMRGGTFFAEVNGQKEPTAEEVRAYNLTQNRITFLHNYYRYLYGLPMKLLEDEATRISPNVERLIFHGQPRLKVTVTYDEPWRDHTWAFFFHPEDFSLQAYQFWRRSSEEDGEYILLEGIQTVDGVRHPKTRHWYNNAGDQHIGSDVLLAKKEGVE